MAGAAIPRVPRATYRLQFNATFRFRDAEAVAGYLASLGISHVYASPYLQARAGSSHGYDIIDHTQLNSELGEPIEYDAMCRAFAARGLGQVLDFVPNHMGIGRDDNLWWLDVLEWGEESPYAEYFDIDWNPAKLELRGKVLVPSLGDHYGKVLAEGQIRLKFNPEDGSFSAWYFEHRFPINPGHYGSILQPVLKEIEKEGTVDELTLADLRLIIAGFTDLRRRARSRRHQSVRRTMAERLKRNLAEMAAQTPQVGHKVSAILDRLNGTPGNATSFESLHRLLEAQPYRLAYWLVAAEEINYRRFFQINDLAGIRIEVPAVFDAAHRLVLNLIERGAIHGLRIDHIDGLFDPKQYLQRLQAKACAAAGIVQSGEGSESSQGSPQSANGIHGFYIVAEKILALHESLRDDWPIAGTTGYDALNRINGLFVDPAGEEPLTRIYERFLGRRPLFHEIAYEGRKLAMDQELASELRVLANEINRLTETNWLTRDYTLVGIRQALREVVASFPVYRTYVDRTGASQSDRRDIDWAIAHGRRRSHRADKSVFDFLHKLITTDLGRGKGNRFNRREVVRLAMKLQQYTGPVMAKGVEDTAFYRFNRLLSLNEVGGEPTRFGTSISAFHHQTAEAGKRWPYAMVSSTTHDTKRGEDARARINVLSEAPLEWGRNAHRWAVLNRRLKSRINDEAVPDPNDEYLLYQTLIGAWPPDFFGSAPIDPAAMDQFRDRIVGYMLKAVREAKVNSSWVSPNPPYEEALSDFVTRALDVRRKNPFIDDFRPFADRIATVGVVNSLAQTTLKLTVPGVPDIYQGSELWDFSLVDPDNRRPVDFAHRAALLDELERSYARMEHRAEVAAALLGEWPTGAVKLMVTWRLLGLRARHPRLFGEGSYQGLEATGGQGNAVVSFVREWNGTPMLVVVPRLTARLAPRSGDWPLGDVGWRDTYLDLPEAFDGLALRNLFTGEVLPQLDRGKNRRLALSLILARFPVAVLATDELCS